MKMPLTGLESLAALQPLRGYSMSNNTTKTCRRCGAAERYKNGNCAPCSREHNRKWRQANPEKVREKGRRWRDQNTEKHREKCRKWNSANPENARVRASKWNKANPKKYQKNIRKWQRANPKKMRVYRQRRRAHENNNESGPYDFEAVCAYYNNRCVKCGKNEIKLTVDHINPLSKGGPDIASNIQPLCLSCNSSKGARYIDYRPDAGPKRWIQKKLFS